MEREVSHACAKLLHTRAESLHACAKLLHAHAESLHACAKLLHMRAESLHTRTKLLHTRAKLTRGHCYPRYSQPRMRQLTPRLRAVSSRKGRAKYKPSKPTFMNKVTRWLKRNHEEPREQIARSIAYLPDSEVKTRLGFTAAEQYGK